MPELFVSYASIDRPRAMQIVDAVQSQGLSVWIDQAGIAGGTSYGTEIANALRDASAVLLIASDASLASKNVRQEIMLAWRFDKPIIPLILHPLVFPDDVAYWLEGAQWIEVLERESDAWMPKLHQALARHGIGFASAAATSVRSEHLPPASIGNLPTHLPPIIGRTSEIEEVLALLEYGRALTLTGPGGTGKTRLAIEIAQRMGPSLPGGAWFVDMAAIVSSDLLLPGIAAVVGAGETPGQSILEAIEAQFGGANALLVLDNLEQVEDASVPLSALLAAIPNISVIATSRARLDMAQEWTYPVPQLALPDVTKLSTVAELGQNAAVRLFVERATQSKPDFQLNDGNARAIAEICHRLDGLPLAIELAAARTRMLPPGVMLTRLGSRLNVLTRGATGTGRQQTLRDTIGWSYNLLDPAQQWVFRNVAIFSGGVSVDAAEAVLNAVVTASGFTGSLMVLDQLEHLVDQALLTIEQTRDEMPRLKMLETIREYGLEQLEATGEAARVRAEHAAFFVRWLEEREQAASISTSGESIETVRDDLGNLRQALSYLKQNGPPTDWWHMTKLLFGFWRTNGPFAEAVDELNQVVYATGAQHPIERADAWAALGWFAAAEGDFPQAEELFTQALEVYQSGERPADAAEMHYQLAMTAEITGAYAVARTHQLERLGFHQEQDDHNRVARVQHDLGRIASFEGDYETAMALVDESLTVYRRLGDLQMIATALYDLATIEMFAGSAEESLAHIGESVAIFRTLHDEYLIATAIATHARAQQLAGDFEAAARTIEDAAERAAALGDANLQSLVLYTRGTNALGQGDLARAERLFLEDFELAQTHGDRWRIAEIYDRLATIAVATGRVEQAARLLGRAGREREETGGHIPPVNLPEHVATSELARSELGEERFEAFLTEGYALETADLIGA